MPPTMILCADVGGTKTKLALFRPDDLVKTAWVQTYASAEVEDLGKLLRELVTREGWTLDAVSLGVAGPVRGTRVETTNLPWVIDATALGASLSGVPVFLLNDLEALAYGIPALPASALATLNPGQSVAKGTIAVIAAGTGLREAARGG